MFSHKTISSSNPELVSIKYLGSQRDLDSVSNFTLSIKHLATPQINRGKPLYPNSKQLPPKVYTFHINISNFDYEFEFEVDKNETNWDVQKKVTDMINRADIGVRASIEKQESDARYYIQIHSNHTGISNLQLTTFAISDNRDAKQPGVLSFLGIDQVEQLPSNANILLDGTEHFSFSNTFTIRNQFEFTLFGTTDDSSPVTVELSIDTDTIYHQITELFECYNKLVLFASVQSSHVKSSKLMLHCNYIFENFKTELSLLGIEQGSECELLVQHDVLKEQIEQEAKNGGIYSGLHRFVDALLERIDTIVLNPLDYVEKTIITYPDTDKKTFPNSYITSMYSGLMFNDYF